MTILVQMDFPTEGPFGEQMTEAFQSLAETIKEEEGFIWKIWTENEATKEAGGIYLFETTEDADRYVAMHTKRLESFGIRDIRVKQFNVNLSLSSQTNMDASVFASLLDEHDHHDN